jgi:hypothetical protein
MLDMIKTYKPKRKKIVRRQGGGGKLGKVLGLGGGVLAGQFAAEHPIPPYLPEEVTKRLGPTKSKVAEIAIEGTALSSAGAGAKKALQTKFMNDLTKKLGIGIIKKVLTGGLGGPIGLGYAAHGLYDMGKPLFDEELARSKKYDSAAEMRAAFWKHLRTSKKWKSGTRVKPGSINPRTGKPRKIGFGQSRQELLKKYPSIAKKLKAKNSGDKFVSKFGYD